MNLKMYRLISLHIERQSSLLWQTHNRIDWMNERD